jgi:hypothetical protein
VSGDQRLLTARQQHSERRTGRSERRRLEPQPALDRKVGRRFLRLAHNDTQTSGTARRSHVKMSGRSLRRLHGGASANSAQCVEETMVVNKTKRRRLGKGKKIALERGDAERERAQFNDDAQKRLKGGVIDVSQHVTQSLKDRKSLQMNIGLIGKVERLGVVSIGMPSARRRVRGGDNATESLCFATNWTRVEADAWHTNACAEASNRGSRWVTTSTWSS